NLFYDISPLEGLSISKLRYEELELDIDNIIDIKELYITE
ncbi:21996_t:CDS:1, partial [Racocetra persica]